MIASHPFLHKSKMPSQVAVDFNIIFFHSRFSIPQVRVQYCHSPPAVNYLGVCDTYGGMHTRNAIVFAPFAFPADLLVLYMRAAAHYLKPLL